MDGPTVDASARSAWLLRSARNTSGRPTLQVMSERLAACGIQTSAATLSQIETGRRRRGGLAGGYERTLHLPDGSLRAAIGIVGRTVGGKAQATEPDLIHPEETLDNLTAAIRAPKATAGDWLRWATAHHHPHSPAPHPSDIARLAIDAGRSVGAGYGTRHEALCTLRCGPHGTLVLETVRELTADPQAQLIVAMALAMSVRPDAELVAWASELLADRRPVVVHVGALAVSHGLAVGSLPWPEWVPLLDVIAAAFETWEPGTGPHRSLCGLAFQLPPELWQPLKPRILRFLSRPPHVERFDRLNPLADTRLLQSAWMAADVAIDTGVGDEGLLARLFFEFVHDYRETRVSAAQFMFNAVPFRHDIYEAIHVQLLGAPAGATRARLLDRLVGAQSGVSVSAPQGWAEGLNPRERSRLIAIQGQAGITPDPAVLTSLVALGGSERQAALRAAGMSGAEQLRELLAHPDPDVSGTAQWWIDAGPAINDEA